MKSSRTNIENTQAPWQEVRNESVIDHLPPRGEFFRGHGDSRRSPGRHRLRRAHDRCAGARPWRATHRETGHGVVRDVVRRSHSAGVQQGRGAAAFVCLQGRDGGVQPVPEDRPDLRHRRLGDRAGRVGQPVRDRHQTGRAAGARARGSAAGRALAAKTQREKDYIDAAGKLFDDFHTLDQRTRMLAYRDSMAALAARYPDDTETSIFYALSLAFSADPADKTYASQLKAGAILEKLLHDPARSPRHRALHYSCLRLPGAGATGAGRRAQLWRRSRRPRRTPWHMPAHTFTRLGLWQESIETNIASAAAARKEGSTSEELHATDYMMYAYLQTGQDRAALEIAEEPPGDRRPLRPRLHGRLPRHPPQGSSRSRRCPPVTRWSMAPGRMPPRSRSTRVPTPIPRR